jgi:hypothetical protein
MRNIYRKTSSGKMLFTLLLTGVSTLFCLTAKAQVSLTATSGASTSANYSTLKEAIDSVNTGRHQGNITIKVHSNTTETAAISLAESGSPLGAVYSALLIAPADTATVAKVISLNLTGTFLLTLNGADNVTIDGRPLATGQGGLLTFSQLSNTANSNTLLLTAGATNNQFIRCNFLNAITGTILSTNVRIGTGNNSNNTFSYATINGGNFGLEVSGTAGTPNNNINVTGCLFVNQKATCIRLGNATTQAGVGDMTIDSNRFTHTVAAATGGFQVVNMSTIEPASVVTFTRNRTFDINVSAANFIHGIFLSPVANSGQFIMRNNSFVLGSTSFPNTASQIIRGFLFTNTFAATVVVENNTFRVGGTHVTANGQPTSVGALKSNSSAASSFTFKNNLCINTRTGSANQHVGYFVSTPTTGTNISDFNTIAGGPTFPAAWLGTFQGDEASFRAAAFPNEQNSTFGVVNFLNNTNPDLAAGNSAKLLLGTPLVTVPTDIYGTTKSLTDPFRGAHESLTPLDSNDASVVIIYTYGKIPIGTTDTARAIIRNNGTRDISNLYVKLTGSLTGFADSVMIGTLPRFKDSLIQVAPYMPTAVGNDTLRVSVASDQNNANNTASWVRQNTLNALAYTNTTLPQTGNVGTVGQGEIVAKFYTPVPNFINQVNVNFNTTGLSFQIVIYEDSGSTLGPKMVPLWVSSAQSTINGVFNLSLPSVPVSDYFYIGVRQTSATNVGFGFQNENPIRNKTFYFRQDNALPAGTYQTLVWNDFAVSAANQFRFMIEPRLKINDDLGVIDVASPGSGCVNLGVQPLKVRIQNLGLLTQNFGSDTLKVFGTLRKPSGTVFNFGPVNITSGTLISDDVIDVDLTSSFDFDSAGAYTITAWCKFRPDNNAVNDTLLNLQRTFLVVSNTPFIQNFNAGLTVPAGWTAARFAVTGGIGAGATNAMRVNLFNTSAFTANATLQSLRISGLTATSVLKFDYRVTNFTGGAATALINTDSIKVLISTDCGATYTIASLINGTNHVPSVNYATYTIPLSTFVGNDIVIRFVCDWLGTTNDAFVDLDNIRVVDGVNDMGVSKVNQPCRSVMAGSASFAPEVVVNNFGTGSQTNVDVHVSITGPASYTGVFTIPNLTGGAATAVSMSTLFNPTIAGVYTLKSWTSLTGDGDSSNDTLTTTFNVTDLNLGDSSARSLTFGTAGSVVRVANSPVLNPASTITLEAWINRVGTGRRTIISKDSAIGFIQYSLVLNDTNRLEFTLNTSGGFLQFVAPDLVPAAYTHVAATFDGTTVKMYMNGAITLMATVTSSTIISNNFDVFIGNHNQGTSTFSGSIDELKIWDVARTEDEIRMNMHKRLGNQPSVNLVAYYRFDEGSGTFATDASGNCNAGIFGTTVPSWTVGTYPLGTPAVATQTVFFDGPVTFTGTGTTISYNSFTGGDTVYMHKFNMVQQGVSPVTNPGGVTAAYPAYWLLYRYGNGTFSTASSSIKFDLGNGLSSGVVVNDLKLFSRANTSTAGWTQVNASASAVSFSNQSVDFSLSTPLFNGQLMIGANNNPLPVTMMSFTGSASRADAILRWITSSEQNNRGFAVERSYDGKRFTEIGFVRGAGNSNRTNTYSYADKNIFATQRIAYYRLKQVDLNGDYSYSNVILVNVNQAARAEVAVYPNPVQKELNIELESATASTAKITVTDISGKMVKELIVNLEEGFNKHTISGLADLRSGVYIINIESNGVVLYNNKLVKTE